MASYLVGGQKVVCLNYRERVDAQRREWWQIGIVLSRSLLKAVGGCQEQRKGWLRRTSFAGKVFWEAESSHTMPGIHGRLRREISNRQQQNVVTRNVEFN